MGDALDSLLEKNPRALKAAIREAEANAARYEAEAEQARAEAGVAHAERRAKTANAKMAEITFARELEKRERELVSDYHQRVYLFSEVVGSTSVDKCMTVLSQWDRLDPKCAVTIIFNSPGGEIINGMALFDFIQGLRRKEHRVTTKALGYAASMAGVLLQAGDERVMGQEAWLLIHEGSMGVSGDMAAVEDTVEWSKRLRERILDIFAERANLSKGQIKRRWHRKDWWLSSDEALKDGFCDSVE